MFKTISQQQLLQPNRSGKYEKFKNSYIMKTETSKDKLTMELSLYLVPEYETMMFKSQCRKD